MVQQDFFFPFSVKEQVFAVGCGGFCEEVLVAGTAVSWFRAKHLGDLDAAWESLFPQCQHHFHSSERAMSGLGQAVLGAEPRRECGAEG